MKRILLITGLFLLLIGVMPSQSGTSIVGPALASTLVSSDVENASGAVGQEQNPASISLTSRRKPRIVHHSTVRNLGGAGASPVSVQFLFFGPATTRLADERTQPFVRWIHNHSAVLANPPPSLR